MITTATIITCGMHRINTGKGMNGTMVVASQHSAKVLQAQQPQMITLRVTQTHVTGTSITQVMA